MKILILNPPFLPYFSRNSRSPAVTKGGTIYYPIWLSYATGVLDKEEFDVKLLDAPAKGLGLKEIVEIAKEFDPQLIVSDTSTPSIDNDVKVAEKLKEETNAFVVLVGTHVSALPDEVMKSSKVDGIARKEYDYTLRDLAHTLGKNGDLSEVKGLTFREDKKIVHNPDRPYIKDLDKLPFVSSIYKKYLKIEDYFYSSANHPMVMMMTGRGCPFRCFFCNWPQVFLGRNYRLRSAEDVVAEFEYILKNIPEVREIGIEDDTLTADIERARKICRLLIEKGIGVKINWWANVRVNLDLKTMKLMKRAGCRLIIPGYESGVQEILNNSNKGITLKQSREFAENAKKAGLMVHGCFILGLPGETEETIKRTIEFAKELDPDDAQFFPLIPYPATEAYEWAKKKGYLTTEDFSNWNTQEGWHGCVVSTSELSDEELLEWTHKAKMSFYLRPKFFVKAFKRALTSWDEMKRTIKASKVFFRYILKILVD
ncbi:MAG: radical SAM protein [Candidatus Aenigmarchaeota archaeon]|nr:radical SAM protein [Candidatus Aenigmarchaeota archaeon]